MQLHYGDWFYIDITTYSPGFEKVNRRAEGYDITPKSVMYMVSAAHDCAKQIGGDLHSALAQLSIAHRFMVFKKPGQQNFTDIVPKYCIVFGKERVTFDNLFNRVKTIPMYADYEIKRNIFSRSDKNYSIECAWENKIVLTNAGSNTIVVDPDNFKIAHSDLPEFSGDLLPVLEKIMTPVQFSPIPPAQKEEFFGPKR